MDSKNYTFLYMLKHNIELTLENFVSLNWMGDKTIENLEGEDWNEIPEELVYAYEQGVRARIQ
jgi:hypothetical protein